MSLSARIRNAIRQRPDWSAEEGVALVTVIVVGFVIISLTTVMATVALAGFRSSHREADWAASLQAAESGVQDYLFRLNEDGEYWKYDDTTPDPNGNDAFTTDVPVPGGASRGSFTYDVDTSQLASQGLIRLTVDGKVDGEDRTVQVDLRRRNFLDYLYFTDLETLDPAAYSSSNQAWAQANCSRYSHGANPRSSSCVDISFYGDSNFIDTINGPLHTNDRIRIFGRPDFRGPTTSSWDLAQTNCLPNRWVDGSGSSAPTFARTCDPAFSPILPLPPSNDEIKIETDASLGKTGCLLTGPSKIELRADGRLLIDSPFTLSPNASCPPVNGLVAGDPPPNGVIYVQNVPTDPSDPNYTAGCPFAGNHPFDADLEPGDITPYGCRDGDAFVWGDVADSMTIATANDINVVEDITYVDPSNTEVLGLVAGNYVQIYHPYGCPSDRIRSDGSCRVSLRNLPVRFENPTNTSAFTDPRVDAAILAVRHSFRVQNYNRGAVLGTLTVNGAIGQKYRGVVGTFSASLGRATHGVEKNYLYDSRLRYLSPPHFLDPVQSAWKVNRWVE